MTSGEQFWRIGSYLQEEVAIDHVAPGVSLEFAHRPLSKYVHVMGTYGLLIEDMVEPPPPDIVVKETGDFPNAGTIPRMLLLLARRLG